MRKATRRPASVRHDSPPEATGPRGRGHRHAAHHALLFSLKPRRRHVGWAIAAVLVVAAAVAAFVYFTDFEFSTITASITDFIGGLNPALVLPMMAVLPVVGFPISVVYLFAGARFGPWGGGLVVAAITLFHFLATHAIARSFLRGPIQRFVERRHKKLPEIPADEHAAVAVIIGLLPGIPYFIRNYVLALSGIRLRTYIWVCLPIYVARSYVTILLGDLSSDPSRRALFTLISVDVLKVVVCAGVIWWLRRHHQRVHGHHDAPPGSVPPTAAAS